MNAHFIGIVDHIKVTRSNLYSLYYAIMVSILHDIGQCVFKRPTQELCHTITEKLAKWVVVEIRAQIQIFSTNFQNTQDKLV